jgi:hypothetical protein
MAEVKILVNNIHDVTHRAASEAEVNVYLKMGFKISSTHQHINPDNGFLMLTTILEKQGDEKAQVKEPVKANEAAPTQKADPAVKEKTDVKEDSEEKPTEEKQTEEKPTEEIKPTQEEPEEPNKEEAGKEEGEDKTKESADNAIPKGFKIKEKKDSATEEPNEKKEKAVEEPAKEEASQENEKKE